MPGNVSAQYNLASLYTSGIGVSKDMTEAATWLDKAARQGHAGAQHMPSRRLASPRRLPYTRARVEPSGLGAW
jgi:TPR repeat protein